MGENISLLMLTHNALSHVLFKGPAMRRAAGEGLETRPDRPASGLVGCPVAELAAIGQAKGDPLVQVHVETRFQRRGVGPEGRPGGNEDNAAGKRNQRV